MWGMLAIIWLLIGLFIFIYGNWREWDEVQLDWQTLPKWMFFLSFSIALLACMLSGPVTLWFVSREI